MQHRLPCVLTVLAIAIGVTSASAVRHATAVNHDRVVVIDAGDPGPEISPLLFGHNIEITRRGGWQGLSAEMVANRKFAVHAGGMPARWTSLGPAAAAAIDETQGYAGTCAARIDVPAAGGPCGIAQEQRTLAARQAAVYAIRLVVRTAAPRTVTLRLRDAATDAVLLERSWPVVAGDWQPLVGHCTAAATSERCRLEIASCEAGVFHVGAVSLAPGDAFHGMRRDVVDLLKRLRPGCLRFPGGCYAEFYPWKDGLLPVDRRPPIGPTGLHFLLPDTDDHDSHEIGIDEFLALCRETGAAPAITVRLSDNSPDDAAHWVEYCNGAADTAWGRRRAARGNAQPWGVNWWFVGNEVYAFGRGGVKDPAIHAERSRAFAEAMHAVDPSIRLVPCTEFVNGKVPRSWNEPLLAALGPLAAAGSVHQYALDQMRLESAADYGRLLRAPQTHARAMLRAARESLDSLVPRPAGRPPGLLYDEWNTAWGQRGSVPMALYAAGVLQMACREAGPLGLEMAAFFMPVNEGVIAVSPAAAEYDTAGHVFDLLHVHQRGRLLPTPEITADDDVDLCATVASRDGGATVWVTAVNRRLDEPRTLTLDVRGLDAPRQAVVDCLVPGSLEIVERMLRPSTVTLPVVTGRVAVVLPPASIARVRLE